MLILIIAYLSNICPTKRSIINDTPYTILSPPPYMSQTIEAAHELNVKELLAAVRKNVDDFFRNTEQFDDITMIVYRLLN